MRILGIETSCDETSAAVVEDGKKLLSNIVATSLDLHIPFGGVVPEIAARSHIEVILPTIDEALKQAKADWADIDAIAVTQGPGLLGSLLIGVLTARTLAIAENKPLYGVNHVEAHVYAGFITQTSLPNYQVSPALPQFPLLALIVSGGHTQLVLFQDHFNYEVLGQTLDDAVGEAFDKVAKMLGLPYPGGPSIAAAAQQGDLAAFLFPKAKLKGYNFSFSGLKTAVLRTAQIQAGQDYAFPSSKLPRALNKTQKDNIAASFQKVATDSLKEALQQAVAEFKPKSVVVAGGVAANQTLRQSVKDIKTEITFPDIKLCTDNAAMIATLGYYQASLKQTKADAYSLGPNPSLTL